MFASKFLYKSFAWKTLSTEITLDKIFFGFGVYMLLSKSRQIFELAPKLCKMSFVDYEAFGASSKTDKQKRSQQPKDKGCVCS